MDCSESVSKMYFGSSLLFSQKLKKTPLLVFDGTSGSTETKYDTSVFVQNSHLRFNCRESNIEDDISMKNQFWI